ncbi:MAG: UDP-3-O-(3-hydroxymyristoyl)glucosamine N-acyltransferase [Armatimonadetes bacterium]|nr:UDP-3-O-(3-hydroxymyristoyl)glucosamine N-acyltransferase [Armatimonadota bacterium]
MENQPQVWTLGELAKTLQAEIVGPADLVISAPATSSSANPNGLAFAESQEYLDEAAASGVGAVIVPMSVESFSKPILRHPAPRAAFGHLLHLFDRPYPFVSGVHPTAVVSPAATVDPTASIGAYAVIEAGATISASVLVMPFAYVGENCTVGEGSRLLPHAVLLRDVTLGENCEIGPGAVLGHSGFGYYWDGTKHVAIPQVGGVTLGDAVDVGALTAIDRATADDTFIDSGNKFDNLVQIAHNVKMGPHGVVASQVGIAGSTRIGARLTAGGQSGFADHVTVTDNVALSGRAGVMNDIQEPGMYGGAPSMPIRQFHRVFSLMSDLPNLVKRLKALEKKIQELEGGE